jgi:cytochrome c
MKKWMVLVSALFSALSASAAQVNTGQQLFDSNACSSCHDATARTVGPALSEIAARYKGKKVVAELAGRIRGGSQGRWGEMPHPANEALTPQEASMLAQWILSRKEKDGK